MTAAVYNGRIRLGRNNFCGAVLIDSGRIVKTGSSKDILHEAAGRAQTEKIDAQGALILPAFNDSHLHLMWLGRRAGSLECSGAKSVDDIIRLGREYLKTRSVLQGSYIQGYGVNPDFFTEGEKRDLCRDDLDKISCSNPVILSRHCGHTVYCNSMALDLAGMARSAPEVEGGTIEKDSGGRPTGVIRENAGRLIQKPIPPYSAAQMRDFISLAMKKVHSAGMTSCGSYDSDGEDFQDIVAAYTGVYKDMAEAGVPGLRVTMQCGISLSDDILRQRLKTPTGTIFWENGEWGTFLKMGAVKIFADGTLGGRTAWMSRPYMDSPGNSGFSLLDRETLNRFVKRSCESGTQVLVHAIGDACADEVTSAFEKVISGGENTLRHGIVHCQFTSGKLLQRMAQNRILALVQPVFLADDLQVIKGRIAPDIAQNSYAWGSMASLGIPVSYSTDAPVTSHDPLTCIQWAVTRRAPGSTQAFNPGECVDTDTAFEAYTQGPAFCAFAENSLGRIAPGYLADLVFLGTDIFAGSPDEIRNAKVLRTMCAGKTVYQV